MEMMDTKIKRIMADILGLDADQIRDSTSMENTMSWDSLAHINLMSAIEQELGITLEIGEMEEMRSFGKILTVIDGKR